MAVSAPWRDEKITEQLKQSIIAKWEVSSSYVRNNVQYKNDKTGKGSQEFDDWLNSGSYGKTIYRSTKMMDEQFAHIQNVKPGDYVD